MEFVELGKVCEVLSGATPSRRKPEYFNGNINWFTPKDLSNLSSKYIDSSPEKITQEGYDSCSTHILPPYSVLFSSRAPIGHIAINLEECSTNQGFKSLVPLKDKVDYLYLFYVLQKNTAKIKSLGRGATFKELSKSDFSKFKIPLPPLPEQQRIAHLLDEADKLRQLNQQLIQKYEQLTQSLFLEMFGDVRNNSKNWKTTKFEHIISLKRGYDLPTKSRIQGEIPVIASTGIVGFHNNYKVEKPCIVTGRSGSIGKVQLTNSKSWPLNTALYGYQTFKNNLIYLKFFVQNFDLKRFSHGAGVPTLDRKLVHREIAPLPPLDLQTQFAERVGLIEAQKQQAQEALQKSEDLFNSLLQEVFKG